MMGETIATGGYGAAVIAAVALVVGAAATQALNYVYREKQIVLSEARTRFVLNRTDAILDWGREIETAALETNKEAMLAHLKAAQSKYGIAARAAHRQDIILRTNWKGGIGEVHGVVESIMVGEDVDYSEAKRKLALCEADTANLLNEVEWWRLFLLRHPMPSRMRVLVRKSIGWGWFGPRKQHTD